MSEQNLNALYPFLEAQPGNPRRHDGALVQSVIDKAGNSIEVKERFFTNHAHDVVDFATAISSVYGNGRRMFSMGNGGSSCDASHFAVEFLHPVTTGRPSLPAVNLTVDTAMLTAISNDIGVTQVFARQIEALAQAGDGLIGFSTSGNSENLITAYKKAKELGLITFGLSGGCGGAMRSCGLVDYCLVVETDSIHRVQETHVAIYHILWDLVHTLLSGARGKISEAEPP